MVNLVPTFDPPPPALFSNMSYFAKIQMRITDLMDSGQNRGFARGLNTRNEKPAKSTHGNNKSNHREISNRISIFGDKIQYARTSSGDNANKLNVGADKTSGNYSENFSRSATQKNTECLSNFVGTDERSSAGSFGKRKEAGVSSKQCTTKDKLFTDSSHNNRNTSNNSNTSNGNCNSNFFQTTNNHHPRQISKLPLDSGSTASVGLDSIGNNTHGRIGHQNMLDTHDGSKIYNIGDDNGNKNIRNNTSNISKSSNKKMKESDGNICDINSDNASFRRQNKTTAEIPPTKKRKSHEKQPESTTTSSDWLQSIQKSNTDLTSINASLSAKFTKADFIGIGNFCRNAGSTNEGLETFVKKANNTQSFAVSIMWNTRSDNISLSSNHSTTTVKYCTPSVSCPLWYCSCDRHIRVQQAFEPVLGALILFPDEPQYQYFLPLSKCINPSNSIERNQNTKTNIDTNIDLKEASTMGTYDGIKEISTESDDCIPLNCQTSLEQRWSSFLQILLHNKAEKIIFNFQLFILPLLAACYGVREDIYTGNGILRKLTLIENIFDPRIAAYVSETDMPESEFELLSLCNKYNIKTPDVRIEGLGSVTISIVRNHSELKSILQLKDILQIEIEKKAGCLKLLRMLEMPLIPLLSLMELRGLEVSQLILKDVSDNLEIKIIEITKSAHQLIGQVFNLASPEQVAKILYDQLKLPSSNSSAKGRHSSTSEEDLQKIRTLHPLVDMILSFRSLSKVSSTYIAGLRPFLLQEKKSKIFKEQSSRCLTGNMNNLIPHEGSRVLTGILPSSTIFHPDQHANPDTDYNIDFDSHFGNIPNNFNVLGKKNNFFQNGKITKTYRVHANWNQTTVRTGRLSCSRPNLQNIPNKQSVGDIDIIIRKAFKPSAGYVRCFHNFVFSIFFNKFIFFISSFFWHNYFFLLLLISSNFVSLPFFSFYFFLFNFYFYFYFCFQNYLFIYYFFLVLVLVLGLGLVLVLGFIFVTVIVIVLFILIFIFILILIFFCVLSLIFIFFLF